MIAKTVNQKRHAQEIELLSKREKMATKYKTGDLYLEDTWSLKSMLGHNLDPQTRWSNVGFVLIEGDSTSNEQDVHVAYSLMEISESRVWMRS